MKLIQWLIKLNSHLEELLRNTAAMLVSVWSAIMFQRSFQHFNLVALDSNSSISPWKMHRRELKKFVRRRSWIMNKVVSKLFLDSAMVIWEESWICYNHCHCNHLVVIQPLSLNSKFTSSLEMQHHKILKIYWRFYLPKISTVLIKN